MPDADGLASLASAAAVTERISLGVGVIPLDRRPPGVIVEQARASGLPPDRLVLGIGSGGPNGALARVRDGLAELDRDVAAKVVVGALGPRMAALAGEVADGVLLNWMTPEYAGRVGRQAVDAALHADRPRPTRMAYVRCTLTPDGEARLEQELASYAGRSHFEQHVARMGSDARDTCVVGPDGATLQAGIVRHEAVLDETIVRAITPDDGLESLLKLLRACAP